MQVSAATMAPAIQARKPKRNLVLILSDDHRFDVMGCAGHPWVKTPGMDRLARGGALLENAFVTTALCSPSRASILTGRYAHAHGIVNNSTLLPQRLWTFPQSLRQNGYRTAFVGKWHMGRQSDMPQPGFDRWASFQGQGTYTDPLINIDGDRRTIRGYTTDILTEEAVRFISEQSGNPFFLLLSHKAVHSEFLPAERHKTLYSDKTAPRPGSMADTEENRRQKPEWVRRQRPTCHGVVGLLGRTDLDEIYRDYCRTLMALDDSIGRVMDELERRRLLDDTLIVYMGDNGFLWGEHGLLDKRAMYEPSIRIPMLAHCPSLFPGGRRLSGMALNIDVAPTLLEMAGVAAPEGLHGRSLLPILTGGGAPRTEFLYEYFWERSFPQTPGVMGIRT